jgi:hypothetical protein
MVLADFYVVVAGSLRIFIGSQLKYTEKRKLCGFVYLTSLGEFLLEKLPVAQPLNNFPTV